MTDCTYQFNTAGGPMTIKGMAQMKAFLAARGVDVINGAGDIDFSGLLPAAGAAGPFTLEESSRLDKVRIKLQDDALRMKRVIQAVKRQGGTVGEAQNFYDANTLMPGRIQSLVDDFREKTFKPMLKKMKDADITPDELALFAYAMHAAERNDYIASINKRMPDGGSGMSTGEANTILMKFAQEGKEKNLKDIHADLMAITASTRKMMLDNGLIDQREFDALEDAYKYYIPLRGLENVNDNGTPRPGVGRGINVRGSETMRALGRRSRASDLIENVVRDHERAITRVEKNDVGKVLLDFVLSNPDPDLWDVNVEKKTRSFDAKSGRVSQSLTIDKGPDTIAVKVGGEIVYIKINDEDLARSLKHAWKDEVGQLDRVTMAAGGFFNNWLRSVLTRYNPLFSAVNIPKDALWSGPAAALKDIGPGGLARYIANYGKAMMSAARQEAGVLGTRSIFGNPRMDAMFQDFKNAGGITGGYFMRSLEDITKDMRSDLLDAGAPATTFWERVKTMPPAKLAKFTLKMLEFMGSTSENATRFALYVAAIESGKSPAQAALVAKEGTTNFNRKGEYGGALNNMFLFYNAGVQGNMQFARVMTNKYVQASMGAVTGVSMMLALYGAAAGGEDDDGEAYWDKIPSYIKERNLVIMLPPGDTLASGIDRVGKHGRYITIPVQYAFNFFPNLGYAVADVIRNSADESKGMSPTKAAFHMASVVFGSANPFGGAIDFSDPINVILAATPTVAKPMVQIGTERNTFGSPSAPTKMPWDVRPDSERMWLSQQNTASAKFAQMLNELGGGNEAKPGKIAGIETSVTPGTIQTLISTTTGGLGNFIEQAATSVVAMTGDDDYYEARSIPFLNKFYGEIGPSENIRNAGERSREISRVVDVIKAQIKVGIDPEMTDDEQRLFALARAQEQYQDQGSKLRKEELRVVKDDSLSSTQKKAKLRELKQSRDELATMLNKAYIESFKVKK